MRTIGFVFLTVFVSACGQQNTKSSLDGSSNPKKPLIIAMAGFSTCRSDENFHNGMHGPMGGRIFRKVEELADAIQLKSGVAPVTLASCFTTESKLLASSSTEPTTVSSPTDDEYISSIHKIMEQYSDVFIIGHSYGGWLAMKLVETYNGQPNKIKSLYSIDPISKKLCFFNNPEYCISAPKDILAAGRQHINDMTNLWVNPWQKKTFFLHSSIIPQADENPQYEVEHYDLDTSESVWTDMKGRISNEDLD
jgi:hypothetical protein